MLGLLRPWRFPADSNAYADCDDMNKQQENASQSRAEPIAGHIKDDEGRNEVAHPAVSNVPAIQIEVFKPNDVPLQTGGCDIFN
nr:putative integron gene cassette protein [uncultured bacterium]